MTSVVYNMDCMEGMAQYPDKYFDLAVVDPPYGIGVNDMSMFDGAKKQVRHKEYKDIVPSEKYFELLFRITKHQIIWGGNYFKLPPTRCNLIWYKIQQFSGADFELAWTSFTYPSKAFEMCRAQAYGSGTIHPTQKPIALYQWIYKNYLPDGGKVLDTHLGSGSNRIAADKAGNIDFTGYELDTDYYLAQEKRWREYKAQLKLFV